MNSKSTSRRAGRPADPAKVQAIIEAGWLLFLKHGVEAVSLEAVAAKAGVSKVTLYKHFPDKPALFEAGVLREMKLIESAQNLGHGRGAQASFRDTLRAFGLGFMGFLASEPAVDFYNSLSGELRRHPDLAARFYAMGPGRTRANLAALLKLAAAHGHVEIHDPEQAAEHLFGLWQGFSNFQLSLGIEVDRIQSTLAARVDRGIDVFLSAYAPKQERKTRPSKPNSIVERHLAEGLYDANEDRTHGPYATAAEAIAALDTSTKRSLKRSRK